MRQRYVLIAILGSACGAFPDPTQQPKDASGSGDSTMRDSTADDASPDGPPQTASCVGLTTNCGASSNDDCCSTAMTVPGGTFFRAYDVATDAMFSTMNAPATVSSFKLDKYEVTVGRFRQFVNAGYGTKAKPPVNGSGGHPNLVSSGWDSAWVQFLPDDTLALKAFLPCDGARSTWSDAPGAKENLPINCVSWYEAMAFCIWDSGYLPTEAEWNFAAAGGSEQRAYPWSSPPGSTTIDCTYANYNIDNPSGTYCVAATNGVGSESPKGDGRWGHSDLAGNVMEWTLDLYAATFITPCTDCANLTQTNSTRVQRGGGWIHLGVRTASRATNYQPTERKSFLGFRCARKPAP
jgi:formylglycine-generating enzyme